MSQINVDAIRASNGTGDAISLTASDKTCTANITNNLSNRNLIINGAMNVAQRGTSHTALGGTAGVYTLDRFRVGGTMNTGRHTITQDSSAPAGFAKSLKVDITTAEASLNAASLNVISQFLEGQDLQHLQKGTATAKSLTLSFWVKSTTTGTYIVELQDFDNSRILNKSYTISAANTWEKKTLTFAGDTTGAFGNDNGASLLLQWWLAAGTNFTSGTLGSSWAATTNANRAVGQTNLFAADTNDFYLTGVQLEVGDYATDFEHRSYGDELLRCCRYYYRITHDGTGSMGWAGPVSAYGSDTNVATIPLPVPMRLKISALETSGTAGDYSIFEAGVTTLSGVPTLRGSGIVEPKVGSVDCPASVTAGRAGQLRISNSAYLGFTAEL